MHSDHLNTPRLVADATGTTVWRWDQQEPFGVSAADENPTGVGNFEFPLRFPGQYADKETNLHYNYFRDYDSGIGRYAQSDPIGLRGGLNTYSYAGSRPLSHVDPKGNIFFIALFGLSGLTLTADLAVIGGAGWWISQSTSRPTSDTASQPMQSSLTDEAEDAGREAADDLRDEGVCPPGTGGGSEECKEVARKCNRKCITKWMSARHAGNEGSSWISVCTNVCANQFGCGTHYR